LRTDLKEKESYTRSRNVKVADLRNKVHDEKMKRKTATDLAAHYRWLLDMNGK